MISQRFGKTIHLTEHARKRMIERDILIELLIDLIETGELNYKDDKHAWIAKYYPQRTDNLLCTAVIVEQTMIIKTVMFHFSFK